MKKLIQKITAALRLSPPILEPIRPVVKMEEFVDDSDLLNWTKIVASELRDGETLPPVVTNTVPFVYTGPFKPVGDISNARRMQKARNAVRVVTNHTLQNDR